MIDGAGHLHRTQSTLLGWAHSGRFHEIGAGRPFLSVCTGPVPVDTCQPGGIINSTPLLFSKGSRLDDQLYGHPEQDSCTVGALPPHVTGSQTHRADRAQCPHFTWGHGRQSFVRDPCYLNNKVYREHLCFSWRKALYLFFPLHFHFSSISISLIH